MFINNFVLKPDKYLLPAYRISPFNTEDIALHNKLPFSAEIDDYFQERFEGRRCLFCESGRAAVNLALQTLQLDAANTVTILTTTGNTYISKCVTTEIEKFCRWSRDWREDTRAILVNHEFGFGYEQLRELKRFQLPVIEDAAHSFASDNSEQSVSRVGLFTVYSFPKFFPIQLGGLLVCDETIDVPEPVSLETKRYMQKILSFYIKRLVSTKEKRRQTFEYFSVKFKELGFSPRFHLTTHSIPGVFMFKSNGQVDLPAMKVFLTNHGIQCSVFYGENAFFLPLHERIETDDVDYFFEAVRFFVEDISNQSEKGSKVVPK
jgi:hypothetical protein